jgi:peptide/nickel transport system permease protein
MRTPGLFLPRLHMERNPMGRYILQRLVGMLVVMFTVVTIVFIIVRIAPGDPAAVMLGPDATQQDISQLRTRLGLDRPLIVQYAFFLGQLIRGDLGESIFLNRPVLSALADRAEPTFFLTLFAIAIASMIAIPIGILSAYRRGSLFDQATTTVAMLAASIPSFWLGLLLIQYLAVRFGLFPVSGYGGPGASLATRLYHLVLPAFALGIVSSALILRFTRASMLDVLNDDYVRTARSKGMGEFRVVMKHAFKNALIPVLTVVGITAALLVSGAVVTETVFGLPGIGSLVVSAVLRRDYPVIQGALLIIAALYVLINFLIDMLYLLIDPRVKY